MMLSSINCVVVVILLRAIVSASVLFQIPEQFFSGIVCFMAIFPEAIFSASCIASKVSWLQIEKDVA